MVSIGFHNLDHKLGPTSSRDILGDLQDQVAMAQGLRWGQGDLE